MEGDVLVDACCLDLLVVHGCGDEFSYLVYGHVLALVLGFVYFVRAAEFAERIELDDVFAHCGIERAVGHAVIVVCRGLLVKHGTRSSSF